MYLGAFFVAEAAAVENWRAWWAAEGKGFGMMRLKPATGGRYMFAGQKLAHHDRLAPGWLRDRGWRVSGV